MKKKRVRKVMDKSVKEASERYRKHLEEITDKLLEHMSKSQMNQILNFILDVFQEGIETRDKITYHRLKEKSFETGKCFKCLTSDKEHTTHYLIEAVPLLEIKSELIPDE